MHFSRPPHFSHSSFSRRCLPALLLALLPACLPAHVAMAATDSGPATTTAVAATAATATTGSTAATSHAATSSVNAQAILAASDAIRNPEKSFGLTATLIEYRSGKQTDTDTLAIYSRADPHGGQFRSLLRFIAPQRDAGKLMLKNGNDLWFYDPGSKATIRLSPQQRLLGQAANGDVVTVNLAKDYHAEAVGEEDIVDGERQTRHCIKLALKANTPEVTYHSAEMWIEHGTNRPVKARFYTESGRLLKTVYYRHYHKALGTERPTETVIIDGLDPQWVTVMRYADYAFRDVPEAWLQRDYLSRFQPE